MLIFMLMLICCISIERLTAYLDDNWVIHVQRLLDFENSILSSYQFYQLSKNQEPTTSRLLIIGLITWSKVNN